MRSIVGRIIDRKFIVGELVGRGKRSRVYRCHRLKEKKKADGAVLKIIPKADGIAVHEFWVERDALASLSNVSGIVQCFGVMEHDRRLVMALERLRGPSLSSLLGKIKTEREVFALVGKLAAILADMHGQGIGHFDLRLSNVFFASSDLAIGSLRLINFGQAGERPALGNMAWQASLASAPEVLDAHVKCQELNASHPLSVDVWALGIIALQLSLAVRQTRPQMHDTPWRCRTTCFTSSRKMPSICHGRLSNFFSSAS